MYNFIKTSTIIFILTILILTIVYIEKFRQELITDLRVISITDNAVGLMNQYYNKVWSKNQNLINNLTQENIFLLNSNPEYLNFIDQSTDLLKELPVVKINIYDAANRKLISNNEISISHYSLAVNNNIFSSLIKKLNNFINSLYFKFISHDEAMKKVSVGEKFSQVITNVTYEDNIKKSVQDATLIQVLIPLVNENKTAGIMEFYYNITNEFNDMQRLRNIVIVCSVVIFCLFFTMLFLISVRLEKKIASQHEVNTELAEAKQKAEMESHEKSKFLANISHELRTPLNAIIGFSEIIKTESLGVVSNQQYVDYANDINSSGTHLLSLINDILDYSKASAAKLNVDSIEVDVTKILLTSMRLVKPRAEEAKVKLVTDIAKESLILIADPKRLKQAVLNLLSNSVKFTQERGSVTLSAFIDHQNMMLNIVVSDTGIGIADKDISKAMSTFGQVDTKLSRKYEGTGLGLPLTKKLVELMKGTFTIVSELGLGTTVTLSFPYNENTSFAKENDQEKDNNDNDKDKE